VTTAQNFVFSELAVYFIILSPNFVALTAEKFNINEFKLGGLHEKQGVATWILRTISTETKITCVEVQAQI
jgi:hypothetical protein